MAETTPLSAPQEIAFRIWAKAQGITDVDHHDSHYDYRGLWKASQGTVTHQPGEHFPDTYKQHGHPTFSVESQYSAGPFDGGRWNGEQFVPPGADMMARSHGQYQPDLDMLRNALLAYLGKH